MLSRLILAAVAVAALTAFVRNDGATASASPEPAAPPLAAAPLPVPAKAALTARSTEVRPVRVVLAPLYSANDGTRPATSAPDAFIPTPGSPVGPRGASLLPAPTRSRVAAQSGTGASHSREARHARKAEATATPRPLAPVERTSVSASLPGVVLR